jgi:hypothetical protein
MLPVAANVPVAGSYNSALARDLEESCPPVISMFPPGNKVAVCDALAEVMLPVGAKTSPGRVLPAPPHPAAVATMTTNMMGDFGITKHTRFDMGPPF